MEEEKWFCKNYNTHNINNIIKYKFDIEKKKVYD